MRRARKINNTLDVSVNINLYMNYKQTCLSSYERVNLSPRNMKSFELLFIKFPRETIELGLYQIGLILVLHMEVLMKLYRWVMMYQVDQVLIVLVLGLAYFGLGLVHDRLVWAIILFSWVR